MERELRNWINSISNPSNSIIKDLQVRKGRERERGGGDQELNK